MQGIKFDPSPHVNRFEQYPPKQPDSALVAARSIAIGNLQKIQGKHVAMIKNVNRPGR